MRVAVVLPAYNESGNLTPLVMELQRVAPSVAECGIVVVNDGSTDGTADELEDLRRRVPAVRVVTHPQNRGFAQALKSGFAAAREAGYDVAVCMDGDLSHSPSDMPRLISAIEAGADVAIGSRFIAGGGMVGVPAWRVAISRAGNGVGRTVLRVPLTDLTTGYRAYRIDVLERVRLEDDSFGIQLEAVIKAYAAGFRIVDVPIRLGTRRHGVSHMRYSVGLFVRYYQLLMKCRRWLREGRAAETVHAS